MGKTTTTKKKTLGCNRLGSLVWPWPSLNRTKHLQIKAQRLEISKQNKNIVYRSGTQLWTLHCLIGLDSWGENHLLTRCCSFATYRSGNVFNIKIAEEIGNAQKSNSRRTETSEPSTLQALSTSSIFPHAPIMVILMYFLKVRKVHKRQHRYLSLQNLGWLNNLYMQRNGQTSTY